MTVKSLRAYTGSANEPNFSVVLLFSLLGFVLSLLVLPLLGPDVGVLALAG
jgi:hypothetical protein